MDRRVVVGFKTAEVEGRPRYDTRMMLTVLLRAYANGVRASRKIEERLHADVVFMCLAGRKKPDIQVIGDFLRRYLPGRQSGVWPDEELATAERRAGRHLSFSDLTERWPALELQEVIESTWVVALLGVRAPSTGVRLAAARGRIP